MESDAAEAAGATWDAAVTAVRSSFTLESIEGITPLKAWVIAEGCWVFTRKAIGVIVGVEGGMDALGALMCAGVCVTGALEVLGREGECMMDANEGRIIGLM